MKKKNKNIIIVTMIVLIIIIGLFFIIKNQKSIIPIKQSWKVTLQDNSVYDLGSPLLVFNTEFICKNKEFNKKVVNNKECFNTLIEFQDKQYVAGNGDKILLNEYVSVIYHSDAQVRKKLVDENDWTFDYANNVFEFIIENNEFLDFSIDDSEQVLFDEQKTIPLTISNNFGGNLQGGVVVKRTDELVHFENIKTYTIIFNDGITNYDIPFDSNKLGKQIIEVTPYVLFDNGNTKIYFSEINKEYRVIQIGLPRPVEPPKTLPVEPPKPFNYYYVIIPILISSALIFWYFKK